MNGEYRVGDKVLGSWMLVRKIGEGSFGKVFEAERTEFGTTYKAAVKIITIPQSTSEIDSARSEGMDDASVTSYFEGMVQDIVQEFALMSKLKGISNIVSYEDHAVVAHEGTLGWDILIRMELLTPLTGKISKTGMDRQEVIRLGVDMCKALELCQKHNIIHRDIKPENIFVSENGDYKLGDFGIARTLEKTSGALSKKGTYTYMAPEVYRDSRYGSNVDIYSLGIVLYRLLNNNRTPFLPAYPNPITYSDREKALMKRISGAEIPMPENAGGRLGEIVLKACAYDPKDRYFSPKQLRQDLEAMIVEAADENDFPEENTIISKTAEQPADPIVRPTGDEGEDDERTRIVSRPAAPKTTIDEKRPAEKKRAEPGEKKKKERVRKKLSLMKKLGIIAGSLVGLFVLLCIAVFINEKAASPIRHEYDEAGNVIREIYYNGWGRVTSSYEYEYDDEGNRVKKSRLYRDGSPEYIYEYDDRGNNIFYVSYTKDGMEDYRTETEYDDQNRKCSEVTYNDGKFYQWISNIYDTNGEIVTRYYYAEDGAVSDRYEYEYDNSGNRIKKIHYTGTDGTVVDIYTEYDSDGNITVYKSFDSDGVPSYWKGYEYNSDGQKIKEITYNPDGTVSYWKEFMYKSDGKVSKTTTYNADGTVKDVSYD